VGPGKAGRNDPCWCGSGKEYKKCHLAEDEKREAEQYKPIPPRSGYFDVIQGRWRSFRSDDLSQHRH